jgi:hypothetical protein
MSGTVSVNGAVTTPLALSPQALAALPQTTVNATVNGQNVTYTGVSVYSLLTQAGLQSPSGKNGVLQDYVTVTDGSGNQVVLSEGEVDPSFGGATSTDIIALTMNGQSIAPTLIVPGDINAGVGGRDLAGVAALTVGEAAKTGVPVIAGPPPTFTVGGAATMPANPYAVASVQALGASTQTDTFLAGATPQTYTFTGATLFSVVSAAGLPAGNVLDDYVVATGSDGYAVLYSLGEIDPAYRAGNVALVAYDDGTGTFPSIGGGGDFRTTAPFDGKGGRYDSNLEALTVASVACFAAGTRIATGTGDIAVEHLRPGMTVRTQDGTSVINWIGHRRIDLARHPHPARVAPVRIRAHAFGPGAPARDLRLSPDHAVFADGVLVPVKHLIDGAHVVQERPDAITYYHVECNDHVVLFAEGLGAESYLDTGDRAGFANGGRPAAPPPDFARRAREAGSCAELVVAGPRLAAARAALAATA